MPATSQTGIRHPKRPLTRVRFRLAALAVLLPPLGVGCQPETLVPVEGIVTLNGRPLGGAEGVFVPDPDPATGGRGSGAAAHTDE